MEYPLKFAYLKHLHAIEISFVTNNKFLNNEIGETFCKKMK